MRALLLLLLASAASAFYRVSVFFSATCHRYHRIAKTLPGINWVNVNGDGANLREAVARNVTSLPCIIVFGEGERELGRASGILAEDWVSAATAPEVPSAPER